ncbi:MAG TPA: type VI secretion system baseplate subunit TssG [Bryobacteraceae bacterium]|nr:type VI secretion system baseplate subunit TssG [Bryobacteraceae bacterium]
MAAPSGSEDLNVSSRYVKVEKLLREDPWHFQFFQAVRLVQRVLTEREPVGRFVPPSKEIVRFGAHPGMSFPASQIQGLDWKPGAQPVMLVNFMGLTGPMGILPLYYTELLMERVRAKDRTLLAFLDLFNHRMISLFYQAWEKYRFTIAYERGERDRFSHHLLDLIGLGTRGLARRQAVADDSLLFYSGLFSLHARSAVSLQQILADYFDVPVEVEQFMGAWHSLDPADQCEFQWGNSYSEQLGLGAVVGDEIWDQQSGIRLRLGPLTAQQYADFLPQGSAYEPLRAITKFFSGGELDFEVQLILKREEVPACELGDASPRLGWSTWVKSVAMTRDPSDTILRI